MKPRQELRYLARSEWRKTDRAPWIKTRVKTDDSEVAVIQGYSSTFNQWYTIRDWFGEFEERFDPKAFNKSLKDQGDSVIGLFNHNVDYPLGSVAAGTMRQGTDNKGLWFEIDASLRSPQSLSVVTAVEREDVTGSSITFQVIRDIWEEDHDEDGNLISERRTILEARLFEHGPVTVPANPFTTADVQEENSTVTDAEVKSVAIKVRRGMQLTSWDLSVVNRNTDLFRQLVNGSAPLDSDHAEAPTEPEHPDASTQDLRRFDKAKRLRSFQNLKWRVRDGSKQTVRAS